MIENDLSQFNIKFAGSLRLKIDYDVRVAATKQLGNNEHWSSDGLYRHLCMLKNLIQRVGKCTRIVRGTDFTYYMSNPPE